MVVVLGTVRQDRGFVQSDPLGAKRKAFNDVFLRYAVTNSEAFNCPFGV